MGKKKIKDTGLGKWLAEKAPSVLGTVGDLLPDQGALGVVKNLLDKEPGIDPAEAKAKIDAEIALMGMFMITMIFDSLDNWPFNVKDSYIDLLQVLMLTAFGAYFAGRTIEKSRKPNT